MIFTKFGREISVGFLFSSIVIGRFKTSHSWALQNQPPLSGRCHRVVRVLDSQALAERGVRHALVGDIVEARVLIARTDAILLVHVSAKPRGSRRTAMLPYPVTRRLKLDHWSAEQIARVLVALPFERRTWVYAAEKGDEVAARYWSKTLPLPFARGDDSDEATYAVTMLLKHKRAPAAFYVLQFAIHNTAALEPDLVMDALEAWLESQAGARQVQGVKYQVHLLFQELQSALERKDLRVNVGRLAKLEWAYRGLLDGHPASPITLHGLLRDEPEFFVDVLGVVFRSKNEPAADSSLVSERKTARRECVPVAQIVARDSRQTGRPNGRRENAAGLDAEGALFGQGSWPARNL
jgi:hypothetical protein